MGIRPYNPIMPQFFVKPWEENTLRRIQIIVEYLLKAHVIDKKSLINVILSRIKPGEEEVPKVYNDLRRFGLILLVEEEKRYLRVYPDAFSEWSGELKAMINPLVANLYVAIKAKNFMLARHILLSSLVLENPLLRIIFEEIILCSLVKRKSSISNLVNRISEIMTAKGYSELSKQILGSSISRTLEIIQKLSNMIVRIENGFVIIEDLNKLGIIVPIKALKVRLSDYKKCLELGIEPVYLAELPTWIRYSYLRCLARLGEINLYLKLTTPGKIEYAWF